MIGEQRQRLGMARRPVPVFILVWLGVVAMMVLLSPHIFKHRFPDVDDALRLVQVRDLMTGQGWFDLHQYRMTPPDGTLMHWSRLVDLPLAGMIRLLALFMPLATAEYATAVTVPLLLLLGTMLTVGKLAHEKLGLKVATLACAIFALAPMVPAQFQPLRIDHHGWQVMTIAIAMWGIARRDAARGAIVAGLAMAAGLIISLETIFMSAGFALVLAGRWLADHEQRHNLVRYLQSLAGGLLVLFALTRGLPDLAAHRDAISPPHLAFFVIMAAGATALAMVRQPSRALMLGGLAGCGVAGLAVIGWWAPQILAPPFAGLDPLVREFWYENVGEGRPLWQQAWVHASAEAFQCLCALGIAIHCAVRGDQGLRRWWGEYAVLLAVAVVSGLLTYRSIAFAGLMATIPFGWFAAQMIARWQSAQALRPKLLAAAALYLVLMPYPLMSVLYSVLATPEEDALLDDTDMTCAIHRTAGLLNRLPTGTLFAPLDIGPNLLLDTHHSIIASGHHRSEAAMHDVIEAFTSDPETARRHILAHKADYVVACVDMHEVLLYEKEGDPQSLAARLVSGNPPDWLEPIALGGPDGLRAWRVLPRQPARTLSQR
ncbi:hypothetical protein [Blastomonas sp. AAP53]|uniref:hypothetical protein n=1 Tax=Blastomonas sp. AAP53 TaxID=1248760 RepID=UPI0002E919CC|nr:hypothetical protein [Blastomonas sp. AAP53]